MNWIKKLNKNQPKERRANSKYPHGYNLTQAKEFWHDEINNILKIQ